MRYADPTQLLRIAIADAYAAGAEFLKFPRDNDVRDSCLAFKGYVAHPTHGHVAGSYTDDTEMSVANARVLLDCTPPYTPLMFADAYMKEFVRGGRRKGYAKGFQSVLESVRTGTELLAKLNPDSRKNGAMMRAVSFGVLPTIAHVLEVATVQASITHNTPEGLFSARAVALMSHFALYENLPLYLMACYCQDHLPKEDLKSFGSVFSGSYSEAPVAATADHSIAITTTHAVVDLVIGVDVANNSLMQMLDRLLRWGGDTDSVAAVAWGIASPRFQDERLPDFMERDLEQGNPYTGAPYLRALGAQLMEKFG